MISAHASALHPLMMRLAQAQTSAAACQSLIDWFSAHDTRCVIWLAPDTQTPELCLGSAPQTDDPALRSWLLTASLDADASLVAAPWDETVVGAALAEDERRFGCLLVWTGQDDLPLVSIAAGMLAARLSTLWTRARLERLTQAQYELGQSLNGIYHHAELWDRLGDFAPILFEATGIFVALRDREHERVSFPLIVEYGTRVDTPTEAVQAFSSAVIAHGRELYVQDAAQERERLAALGIPPDIHGLDVRAWLGVPIRSRSVDVIGMIGIQHLAANAFDEHDVTLLIGLAGQIGAALSSLGLQESQRKRRLLTDALVEMAQMTASGMREQEIFQRMLEHTYRLVYFDEASIWTCSEHGGETYLALAASTLDETPFSPVSFAVSAFAPAQSVVHSQQPLVINDLAAYDTPLVELLASARAWLGVPLAVHGQLLGVMMLTQMIPNAYTEQDASTAFTLARQSAVALHSAITHSQQQMTMELLDQRLRRLASINRIAAVINSAVVRRDVLNMAMLLLLDLMGADHCTVFTVEHDTITLLADHPASLDPNWQITAHDSQVMGDLLRFQTAVTVTDLEHMQADPVPRLLFQSAGSQHSLIAPLTSPNGVVGAISVERQRTEQPFSQEERDTLLSIIGPIALALNNADLYEQALSANRLKSEFLANISHELRTPLNAILGYSDMLLQGLYGELNPQQIDRLQRVHNGGKNLLTMIDNVLGLARVEAGRMRLKLAPLALVEVVQALAETSRVQATEKGIDFSVTLNDGADAFLVTADSDALKHVLTNLLDNALKFTTEGAVGIHISRLSIWRGQTLYGTPAPGRIQVPDGDWAVVTVHDTGIGIKPEDQAIIFDAFRQADGSSVREYGGSGLGLALSRRLIEQMNAIIWLESTPGKGSRFTCLLPLAVDEPDDIAGVHRQEMLILASPARAARLAAGVTERFPNRHPIVTGRPARFLELARQQRPTCLVVEPSCVPNAFWKLLTLLKRDPATADIPVLIADASERGVLGIYLRIHDLFDSNDSLDRVITLVRRYVTDSRDRMICVGCEPYIEPLRRAGFQVFGLAQDDHLPSEINRSGASLLLLDFASALRSSLITLASANLDPVMHHIPVLALVPAHEDTQMQPDAAVLRGTQSAALDEQLLSIPMTAIRR